jgi:hypothetical protein
VEECRNAEGHATVNTSNQTPAQIPGKPGAAFDPSTAEVDTMRTKTFAADQATGQFLIDGQMFDENQIEQRCSSVCWMFRPQIGPLATA